MVPSASACHVMTPVWRSRAAAGTCHSAQALSRRKQACMCAVVGQQSHTAISSCKHHAPNSSANALPLLVPLHTQASLATPSSSSSSCRAPSRAVLTPGTTVPLTTTATTTTTDTPNAMTTATTNHHATGAATTDMTTNTPTEAMTTDTTTATQSHRTAGGGIATTRRPPTQMNPTTHADAHTRLHLAALARANRPAEKRRRKTPSSTIWAKLPSLLA